MTSVADVMKQLHTWYPPSLAQQWDAVGLVTGRLDAAVSSILVTVDVTAEVVAEAAAMNADMIIAHHPLLFGGVTSVAAHDATGTVVHDLIENRIALLVAHTNADSGHLGVSDALCDVLGIVETRPLEPVTGAALDTLVVFVPQANTQDLIDALAAVGAGAIGHYDRCAFTSTGQGTFRPQQGADPHIGEVGRVESVAEDRLEMVFERNRRAAVVEALRASHPYEEPAFGIYQQTDADSGLGLGRIGRLSTPLSLAEFADLVAERLPTTHHGVRVGGDLGRVIERVAVCGGSGDSLLPAANAAGADAFVTADLKHHVVGEHLADGGCAVIDVAHYASEFPWCELVADRLGKVFGAVADNVSIQVSQIVTDPWSHHVRSTP